MKAVTIDKAEYEPTATDLMRQEIKKRNLGDEDIEKFPETYSRQIIFEQIYNFVLEQIRIGADKWTIAKSLVETGMDKKDALQLVEKIHAQILKAREEEPQQEPITVKPFKDSAKDIRPLVALIFLPGLYFCLFLSAVVSLLGAGLLIYILYGLSSGIGLIPTGIMALIAIGGLLGVVRECNRVTSSDVMDLSDIFWVSPRVRHSLVQRIYLSNFYVKHKFPCLPRKFGDQSMLEKSSGSDIIIA